MPTKCHTRFAEHIVLFIAKCIDYKKLKAELFHLVNMLHRFRVYIRPIRHVIIWSNPDGSSNSAFLRLSITVIFEILINKYVLCDSKIRIS